jgi:hypothetical protein
VDEAEVFVRGEDIFEVPELKEERLFCGTLPAKVKGARNQVVAQFAKKSTPGVCHPEQVPRWRDAVEGSVPLLKNDSQS